MQPRDLLALGLPLISAPALAAELTLKLDIPQLNVAEYHRPYVAVWLEKPDQKVATHLTILYDLRKRDNGGAKYLKDMRQWWRKVGSELQLPADGLSGATRAPGEQTLSFPGARAALDKLPPGDYVVVVEVARESGGREVVKLPIQWPPKTAQNVGAKGQEEVGAVTVQLKP